MSDLRLKYRDGIKEVADTARRTAELGFVTSHGGNVSLRLDENAVAITPTKVAKRLVHEPDVVVLDMDGQVLAAENDRRPTGETPIHLHLLRQRPDIRGLVHAHPPVLTGFAIAGSDLLARPILPEPILEVGPVATVDYAEPLTDELARTFDAALPTHNAFLMRNHGALFMAAEGCARALDFLEMTEAMGQSLLTAQQLGTLNELPRADVENLSRTLKTRGLPLPGTPGAVTGLTDLYF